MKIKKKVISNLNRCYAVSMLSYQGQQRFLVAAERSDPCYLFSSEGTLLETVWEGPGGVMSMEQVPGTDGQFLSTKKFFSPDESLESEIVIVTPRGTNDWEMRTLCHIPFIHRLSILKRAGIRYLIACCLKTGHEYVNDWRFPGACFGAELPEDLSAFDEKHTLPFQAIQEGLYQNHGFCKIQRGGYEAALVACESGTYILDPPAVRGAKWTVTRICSIPSSDSVLIDFDGDGKLELGCISPFHGNSLTIYHLDPFGNYVPRWKLGRPESETKMIHGTWAGDILGKPTWIVGWRQGTRDTIAVTWDEEAGDYRTEYLDHNVGMANAMHFLNEKGEDVIVGTNYQTNEVAMYTITE